MKKKLFAMLMVFLAVLVIATPALAQRRGQKSNQRQYRSVRPRQPYQRYRSYRPYYRWYYGGGYRYYGGYGYDGYGYDYGGYGYRHIWRVYPTGIKFNLDLVPENERPAVKRGIVLVDGTEVGIVNRHDGWWNGILSVPPGDHQVVVEMEDGRIFETQVIVYPSQIRYVYIRSPRFLPRGITPPAPSDQELDPKDPES